MSSRKSDTFASFRTILSTTPIDKQVLVITEEATRHPLGDTIRKQRPGLRHVRPSAGPSWPAGLGWPLRVCLQVPRALLWQQEAFQNASQVPTRPGPGTSEPHLFGGNNAGRELRTQGQPQVPRAHLGSSVPETAIIRRPKS